MAMHHSGRVAAGFVILCGSVLLQAAEPVGRGYAVVVELLGTPGKLGEGLVSDTDRATHTVVRDGSYRFGEGPEPWGNEIQRNTIVVSRDGKKAARITKRGEQWFVATDGRLSSPFERIRFPLLGFREPGDRFTYIGTREGDEHAVVDGKVGPGFGHVADITFSPDGTRHAYFAEIFQGSADGDTITRERSGKPETIAVLDGNPISGFQPVIDEHAIPRPQPFFSHDGRRFAFIAAAGDKQQVVVDGRADQTYDEIPSYGPSFSPDGRHYAYFARRGKQWTVVVDGKPGPFHTNAHELVWGPAPGRVTYLAVESDGSCLVQDGRMGPRYDNAWFTTLDPTGRRVAFVAALGNKQLVVVDGVRGPLFDEIGEGYHTRLVFSPDGSHLAYQAVDGEQECVVVDGVPGPMYDDVAQDIAFSHDGRHIAYIAHSDGKDRVIRDGRPGPRFDLVDEQSIRLSPDGEHLAYLAVSGEKSFVVLDDQRGPGFGRIGFGEVKPIFHASGVVEYRVRQGNKRYRVTHTPVPAATRPGEGQ